MEADASVEWDTPNRRRRSRLTSPFDTLPGRVWLLFAIIRAADYSVAWGDPESDRVPCQFRYPQTFLAAVGSDRST